MWKSAREIGERDEEGEVREMKREREGEKEREN